jgi:hypothetical protein
MDESEKTKKTGYGWNDERRPNSRIRRIRRRRGGDCTWSRRPDRSGGCLGRSIASRRRRESGRKLSTAQSFWSSSMWDCSIRIRARGRTSSSATSSVPTSSKRPSRGSDHNGAGHRRRIDSGDTAGVFGCVVGYRSIVQLVRERFRITVSVIDGLSERVAVSNYKFFYCVLFLTHVMLLVPGSMMVELFGGSPVAA